MPVPTLTRPNARSGLSATRTELQQLRRQRTQLQQDEAAAKEALNKIIAAGTDANALANSDEFRAMDDVIRRKESLSKQIQEKQQVENQLLTLLGNADGIGPREGLLEDPERLERFVNSINSSQPIGRQDWGIVIDRDTIHERLEANRQAMGLASDLRMTGFGGRMLAAAGDVTLPSDASRTGPAPWGTLPQLRRELTLLDVIPTAVTEHKVVTYMQETGSLDSGPAETAEWTVVPPDNLTLTDASAPVVAIAGYAHVSRDELADVASLGTIINMRLPYKVQRRTENQILAGDGTGSNLLGITHATGIGAPASVAGDTVNNDLILNGISTVLQSEAVPDAIAVNPVDWAKAAKAKAAGSGERLDSGGAYSDIPMTLWGVPLIRSTAIPVGHALVGDFGQGAVLWLRQGMTLLTSDADQDDFVRRLVKVLAEWRVGLSVYRPACFAYVTLSFAS